VSVGMDAKAAQGFHALRERRPALAASRLANQFWYTYFSCASGWFCAATPLHRTLELDVMRVEGGAWEDVPLPPSVKALVLLNLQSYGGGRDLWGRHDTEVRAMIRRCPLASAEAVAAAGGVCAPVATACAGGPCGSAHL
jgi:diacylglycerol kinase (ATP)